jgi:ADP-L-glycero-D-manno-heptose 6-epimerase
MDLARSRVLLTGGAGFIGSALLWALNRRGCERVVVADTHAADDPRGHLAPLRFERYEPADGLHDRLRSGQLGAFDLVLHLGACSSTTEMDVAYLTRNNYEYTRDLAAWADANGVRFVYASSASTYGDGSAGMSDTDPRLDRLQPLNPYGESKHRFDVHAQREGLLDRIVGLKYFNVFGPNEDHKGDMRSVVHKAFGQVRETGVIRLFKSYREGFRDGEQKRDFLYVKDAVAMTLHLATDARAHGLFNVGSGVAHTWVELAAAVFDAMGLPPRIEFIEMPPALRDKYQYYTCADIGKLRQAGYDAPVTPLHDAVGDYVRNYLAPGRGLALDDL